ncbi:hypothetical protein HDU89_001626 [Geranomyces variabilis]|nr:hypothetical protein HDU89_001626 [Geranomyces variabilis]
MAAVFSARPEPDVLVRRHHKPSIPQPRSQPPPPPLPRHSQQPLSTAQKQKQKPQEQQQQQRRKQQQTRRRSSPPSAPSQGQLRRDAPATNAPRPSTPPATSSSSRPARSPPPPAPPLQNIPPQNPKPVLLLRDRLSTLIVDPRLRVQLGLTPDVNPALLRHPTQQPPPSSVVADDSGEDALARPALNSTCALHAEARRTAAEQFDPVAAVQALMEVDQGTARDVQSRITAKSLNIKRTHQQYHNLARIPSPSSPSPNTSATSPQPPAHFIPRAKKSVPKAYLAARAPPPPPFIATERPQTHASHQHAELDTISLPYPQEELVSPYHDAAGEGGKGQDGGGKEAEEAEEAVGAELPLREKGAELPRPASNRTVSDILRRVTMTRKRTLVGEMMDVEDLTRWQWYLRPVRVEDF